MEWTLVTVIIVIAVVLVVFKLLKFTTKFIFKAVVIFLIFLLALHVYNNYIKDSYVKAPVIEEPPPEEPVIGPAEPPVNVSANATGPEGLPEEGEAGT